MMHSCTARLLGFRCSASDHVKLQMLVLDKLRAMQLHEMHPTGACDYELHSRN